MNDKPEVKRWRWGKTARIAAVLLVLYPISAFPVFFGLTHLVKWGVISQESSGMVGKTVYAPLGWVLTHSDMAGRVFRFLGQYFEETPKPKPQN